MGTMLNQLNQLIILSFLFLAPSSIQTIQVTDLVAPNMDTYVTQDEPTISHGSLDTLTMGKNGSALYYILLFYDIRNYVGISMLELRLDRSNPSQAVTFNVDMVTSNWDESVTWQNRPTDTDLPILSQTCSADNMACPINLLDIYIEWYHGEPNYGIVLRDPYANYLANFSSREATVPLDQLRMFITYDTFAEFTSYNLVLILIPLILLIAVKKKT